MTTAVLSYHRIQKNIQAKINSVAMPEVNWKKLCFIGFFVGLSLLVFYVFQVTALTKNAFLISSYEKQAEKLSQENRNLQVSFAESSFLGQALTKIQALNFQKTTSVKYIQILNSSAKVSKPLEKI